MINSIPWSSDAETPPRYPFTLLTFLPETAWNLLIDASLVVLHGNVAASPVPDPGTHASPPLHSSPKRLLQRISAYTNLNWPVPDALWPEVRSMLIYLPYTCIHLDIWQQICQDLPLLLSQRVQSDWYKLVPVLGSQPSAQVDNS